MQQNNSSKESLNENFWDELSEMSEVTSSEDRLKNDTINKIQNIEKEEAQGSGDEQIDTTEKVDVISSNSQQSCFITTEELSELTEDIFSDDDGDTFLFTHKGLSTSIDKISSKIEEMKISKITSEDDIISDDDEIAACGIISQEAKCDDNMENSDIIAIDDINIPDTMSAATDNNINGLSINSNDGFITEVIPDDIWGDDVEFIIKKETKRDIKIIEEHNSEIQSNIVTNSNSNPLIADTQNITFDSDNIIEEKITTKSNYNPLLKEENKNSIPFIIPKPNYEQPKEYPKPRLDSHATFIMINGKLLVFKPTRLLRYNSNNIAYETISSIPSFYKIKNIKSSERLKLIEEYFKLKDKTIKNISNLLECGKIKISLNDDINKMMGLAFSSREDAVDNCIRKGEWALAILLSLKNKKLREQTFITFMQNTIKPEFMHNIMDLIGINELECGKGDKLYHDNMMNNDGLNSKLDEIECNDNVFGNNAFTNTQIILYLQSTLENLYISENFHVFLVKLAQTNQIIFLLVLLALNDIIGVEIQQYYYAFRNNLQVIDLLLSAKKRGLDKLIYNAIIIYNEFDFKDEARRIFNENKEYMKREYCDKCEELFGNKRWKGFGGFKNIFDRGISRMIGIEEEEISFRDLKKEIINEKSSDIKTDAINPLIDKVSSNNDGDTKIDNIKNDDSLIDKKIDGQTIKTKEIIVNDKQLDNAIPKIKGSSVYENKQFAQSFADFSIKTNEKEKFIDDTTLITPKKEEVKKSGGSIFGIFNIFKKSEKIKIDTNEFKEDDFVYDPVAKKWICKSMEDSKREGEIKPLKVPVKIKSAPKLGALKDNSANFKSDGSISSRYAMKKINHKKEGLVSIPGVLEKKKTNSQ
ncbi:hypothetical protein TCON_0703 [Astathelohania contejeani]|uniref:Uncharacterized protein n=1 Tax=Astathelohania contejeani TaxID=164912 RepID=A0ABQ7I0W0_9MICR|nr:hypothetical protein TCON_0703 [Thelohania contejeani]